MNSSPLVLIIDPDPDSRQILAAFLAHGGYRVEQAADAASGLEAARHHRPAVILGEHPLRLADGQAVCAALHSDPAMSDIPFIAVTANAMLEEVDDAASTHAMVFTKPLDLPAVIRAVRELSVRSSQSSCAG
ncbi:MAG: response regulator [Gemmatimonadetes bacterium]|nr:response regulator [Gemmatimonadota bacterium]